MGHGTEASKQARSNKRGQCSEFALQQCERLRELKLSRVHLFTLIQLACFVLLLIVKNLNAINIGFPLMLLALCFVRKLLDFAFTRQELRLLDDMMWPEHKIEEAMQLQPSKMLSEQSREPSVTKDADDAPPEDKSL